MRAADEFGKGFLAGAQMFYAAVSYRLHLERPADIGARVRELWAAYNLIAPLPEGHFYTGFGHLGGYSSAYYTYMWSLVIAKDLFGAFDPDDLFAPEVAHRYRDRVLAPGGSKDAADLVEDFLGRPYDAAAFRPGWSGAPSCELPAPRPAPPTRTTAPACAASTTPGSTERWADPETRVLVVSGTRLRPVDGAVDWRPTADVPDGTRVLLGERDGRHWFAVLVDPADAPGERGDWVGLRALLPPLAAGPVDEAPLLFHAIGLAEWHYATRFCPRCGDRPGVPRGRARAALPGLRQDAVPADRPGGDHGGHPRRAATTRRCLLGRQHSWPEGRYSTLAGFCEPGETLEDAVRREVQEEVGVPVGEVTYFGNQPWPLPASLMLGFVGAGAAPASSRSTATRSRTARWFTRDGAAGRDRRRAGGHPGRVSISSSLLEHWYGGPLAGGW